MNAYFLSHNGLGDNLISIGALRFLLRYYNTIYFLCKDIYYENVKLFFSDEPRIQCVPFNSKDEYNECNKIIQTNYIQNDIFICGNHRQYLKSKITNKELLEYKSDTTKYTVDYDTLTSENFTFVKGLYNDINLDLSIYFDWWSFPKTQKSSELYQLVKEYYIIFLQTKTSLHHTLNIDQLKAKYLYDEKVIMISNDENLYTNLTIQNYSILNKKRIGARFVKEKIVDYYDTILNSDEIYIIDSCFTGILLPLIKTNKLKKAKTVRIIRRDLVDSIKL